MRPHADFAAGTSAKAQEGFSVPTTRVTEIPSFHQAEKEPNSVQTLKILPCTRAQTPLPKHPLSLKKEFRFQLRLSLSELGNLAASTKIGSIPVVLMLPGSLTLQVSMLPA